MLDAFRYLLCSKLCWHNRPVPIVDPLVWPTLLRARNYLAALAVKRVWSHPLTEVVQLECNYCLKLLDSRGLLRTTLIVFTSSYLVGYDVTTNHSDDRIKLPKPKDGERTKIFFPKPVLAMSITQ